MYVEQMAMLTDPGVPFKLTDQWNALVLAGRAPSKAVSMYDTGTATVARVGDTGLFFICRLLSKCLYPGAYCLGKG